jgi:hypothetical protein
VPPPSVPCACTERLATQCNEPFLQLGPDNLSNLKEIASQYRGDEGGDGGDDDDDDDDDDVPDLVDSETFDETQ